MIIFLGKKKRMHIRIDDAYRIRNMGRVAGIEPASLAWKARGYSRRRFSILNVSNSKPNMKILFHSAPLWKIDVFPEIKIRSITSMSAFLIKDTQSHSLSR